LICFDGKSTSILWPNLPANAGATVSIQNTDVGVPPGLPEPLMGIGLFFGIGFQPSRPVSFSGPLVFTLGSATIGPSTTFTVYVYTTPLGGPIFFTPVEATSATVVGDTLTFKLAFPEATAQANEYIIEVILD